MKRLHVQGFYKIYNYLINKYEKFISKKEYPEATKNIIFNAIVAWCEDINSGKTFKHAYANEEGNVEIEVKTNIEEITDRLLCYTGIALNSNSKEHINETIKVQN